MEFQQISFEKLSQYENLFKICFEHNDLTKNYLEWLYFHNPLGQVIGFDAVEDGKVVAHYPCIPTKIDNYYGLLALNNATHPDFRSRGLHQKLALQTFEIAKKDFFFIIAVVNYNSVNNYLDKLGFNQLGRLNLRLGYLNKHKKGSRKWNQEELKWRINSPKSKFTLHKTFTGDVYIYCRPKKIPITLKSKVNLESPIDYQKTKRPIIPFGFTIDWKINHTPIFYLPQKFKPSPLILIIKQLKGINIIVNSWSFPDFDAY
jgi:hypothetical protein